ncbi:extracellular solute-binding protein, partial [Bradyrhizobium sp. NBAIM08]|uniref:extracellular solute-binding protein n=1 Tax=Bradyrhizobium sp. NBAIM08 TaxID=2793815 RepID=UPI001CD72E97
IFEEAGLDPDNPPLATYDEFLATAQTLVDSGGVQAAIWPSPAGEFFQPWFDFYPLYIAQSGLPLVADGQATFASEDGFAVAAFWRSLYDAELVPREAYTADAFADGVSAMSIVGPWAIAVYGEDVDWGVVPVPTAEATPAEEIQTFSDEKSIGMY